MKAHAFIPCFLGLVLSLTLYAQRSGQPGMGTGAGGSIPGNPTPGMGRPGSLPEDATLDQQQQQVQIVTGRVVLEDGTPPQDPVVIQLICSGLPRSIAYTDSKGRFSADLNNRLSQAMFADASERGLGPDPLNPLDSRPSVPNGVTSNSNLHRQELMSCELRAYQPGFRSDTIQLATRRVLDKPDVGVLTLRRLSKVEGLTISATSALAPADAKKAFEKAYKEELKEKWPDAEKEIQKAVKLYPKYASAWYELGNIQQAQHDEEGARQSYAKALEADPKFVSPYGQLAALAASERKWQEVVDDTNHLLQLDPVDFPQAWLYNAVAQFGLQNWEGAAKSAREGLVHDPNHRYPKLNQVLGGALAMQKDYPGSVENLRDYLRYSPNAADADQVKGQIAQIEKALEPQTGKQ